MGGSGWGRAHASRSGDAARGEVREEESLPWDETPPNLDEPAFGGGRRAIAGALSLTDEPVVQRSSGSTSWKGKEVEHLVFGRGRVQEQDGSGPDARLSIEFPGFGRKKIVARFAQLLR